MERYIEAIEAVSELDQMKAYLLRLQGRLNGVPSHWEVKSAKRYVFNELRKLNEDLCMYERSLQIHSAKYRRWRNSQS